jgi:hypothetical protein
VYLVRCKLLSINIKIDPTLERLCVVVVLFPLSHIRLHNSLIHFTIIPLTRVTEEEKVNT